MPRIDWSTTTPWITEAVLAHSEDLPAHLMQRLCISRRAAVTTLARLADAQWVARTGTTRPPRFVPGLQRQVVRRYPLQGLEEDLPRSRDFAPALALPPNVARRHKGRGRHFTTLIADVLDLHANDAAFELRA